MIDSLPKKKPDSNWLMIEIPLVLHKEDIQNPNWNKDAYLDVIRSTYADALDNEIEKRGWLKRKKKR